MARFKKFPGVEIVTDILDSVSLSVVKKVVPGAAYGHSVAIGKLHAMWPLQLRVTSTLRDDKQLVFRTGVPEVINTTHWDWEVVLHPNRSPGDESRLLVCSPAKVRQTDRIAVEVASSQTVEEQPVEVKIE
jgi:hypothetical protein